MSRLLASLLMLILASISPGDAASGKNAYQLPDTIYAARGYDWWWQNFVAEDDAGNKVPFFLQYFVINPAGGGPNPIFPASGRTPSYARLTAGTWGNTDLGIAPLQLHNYYGINSFQASTAVMDVSIGPAGTNTATETYIKGAVSSPIPQAPPAFPEGGDAGTITWELGVARQLTFDVGVVTSSQIVSSYAFQMLWHVQKMSAMFNGTITLNGATFKVIPERSFGYQDKNWGNDYTNPWIWLSSNQLKSSGGGLVLANTSLVVGGGQPQVYGLPLGQKVIVALYYKGVLYAWNFADLLRPMPEQTINVQEQATSISWNITSSDSNLAIKPMKIVISFTSPKSKMLKLNYINPGGVQKHKNLWNGGYLTGTVTLYERGWALPGQQRVWKVVDTLSAEMAAGEFGVN